MGYFKNILIYKEEKGDSCEYCGKALVTAGSERSNGKFGGSLIKAYRTMHIKCYKLKKEQDRALQVIQNNLPNN